MGVGRGRRERSRPTGRRDGVCQVVNGPKESTVFGINSRVDGAKLMNEEHA